MTLFHATDLNLSFGLGTLLDEAALRLDEGERVCLVGRNGQGKTNLVEAIDYLSRLASHRVASDTPPMRIELRQPLLKAAATVFLRCCRQRSLAAE